MKNQNLLTSRLSFIFILFLVAGIGCSTKTETKQAPATAEELPPTKPTCEVEYSASSLKNALLAPSENIKLTVIKLHELAEGHHHERVSEQAAYVAGENVKLMNSAAYLSNLDSILAYCVQSAVTANSLQAHNESLAKTKLKSTVSNLESLSDRITAYVDRKIRIDKDICLTNKKMLENQIRLYFHTINTGIGTVESSLKSTCEDCLAKEIGFYESQIKSFREALIKAPTSQYKTVSRTLADLEHTLNELSTMHDSEEKHHAMETIERQLDRLRDELLDITGLSRL